MIRSRLAFLAVVVGGVVSGAFLPRASAQMMKPTTIDFVVPEGTPIVLPASNDAGDVVIFVGRSQGTTPGGTCGAYAESYPVQTAIIVDPGDGRATRQSNVIPLEKDAVPVHAGTRLGNLQLVGSCQNGSVGYNYYRGEIQ